MAFGVNLTSNWTPPYYYHPVADIIKGTGVGWKVSAGDPDAFEWDALGHPSFIPPGGKCDLRFGQYARKPPGYGNSIVMQFGDLPGATLTRSGNGPTDLVFWSTGAPVPAGEYALHYRDNGVFRLELHGGVDGVHLIFQGVAFFEDDRAAIDAGEISSFAMRRHLQNVPRVRDLDLSRTNFPDDKRAQGLPTFTMVGKYNRYHGLTPAEVIQLADECGVPEVWLCLSAGTGWSESGRLALRNALGNSNLLRAYVQIGNEIHLGNGITNTNRHWYRDMAIALWGEYVVPPSHDPADLAAQTGRIVRDSAIRWDNGLRWNHIRVLNDDLAAAGLPRVWAEGEVISQLELLDQWALWKGMGFDADIGRSIDIGGTEIVPVLGGHGGWGRASEVLLKSNVIQTLGVPASAIPAGVHASDVVAIWNEAIEFIRSYAIACYPIFSDQSLRYQPGDENDPARQAAQIAHLEGSLDRAFDALAEHKQRLAAEAPWISVSVYEFGLDIPSVTQDPNEPAHWSALTRIHPEAARMNQALVDRITASGATVAFRYHDCSYAVTRHGDWGALPDMATGPGDWALTAPGKPLADAWAAEGPITPPAPPAPEPEPPVDPQPDERAVRFARIRADLDWLEANG